jgi:hypothetical protein
MRIVVVSGTHGLHDQIGSLPAGEVFVHAGDFMNSGLHGEEYCPSIAGWPDFRSNPGWSVLGIMTGFSN